MQKIDLEKANYLLNDFERIDLIDMLKNAGLMNGNSPLVGIDLDTQKLRFITERIFDVNTPWVHPYPDSKRDCMLWHSIVFKAFPFIPSPCLNCWKVVVRPRTVRELFQVYNMQVDLRRWGKCGLEIERPYVNALYGAYFYNDSKEEGWERYKEVRKAVDEQISPDVSVILKKYCSEFELKFGNSSKYKQAKEAERWEAILDKHFMPFNKSARGQPPVLQIHIMNNWLKFAYQHQDPTAMMFNNGKSFYTKPHEYHQGLLKKERK